MNKDVPDNPRTLGETVTAEIRRKLVGGELVPGQRLSEAALSESLDISRNTLREAFRVLTQEGLLKHCLLYTSPSPRDLSTSRMPSSA